MLYFINNYKMWFFLYNRQHCSVKSFENSKQVCIQFFSCCLIYLCCCFYVFYASFIDNENPVISCPANQTNIVDRHNYNTSIQWDNPSATDNSGDIPTIECNPSNGIIFDKASTPVICTAHDDYGNVANCSFYIDIIGKMFLHWTSRLN